jgi:3-deoxy-7-phosphoheptulonate synthase
MSYQVIKSLPSVQELHKKYPLTEDLKQQIQTDILEIKNILSGNDSRKIMIIGPCSAWPSESVIEYAKALKPIKEKYSHLIKFVMRVYIQKPRTTIGWLGPVNQPSPFDEPDIAKGFNYCRNMMLEVIKLGYAIADELLYTHKKGYFTDLYSWVAIGARSTEDQEHRLFASMLDIPVGMKNTTDGNIQKGINSVIAAQYSHNFAISGNQIKTDGNPYAHLILRGGNNTGNYDLNSLITATTGLIEKKIKNPSIIVDLSHDNSINPQTGKKDPLRQPEILNSVLESIKKEPNLNNYIKGFMIESFIEDGKQNINTCTDLNSVKKGVSISKKSCFISNSTCWNKFRCF